MPLNPPDEYRQAGMLMVGAGVLNLTLVSGLLAMAGCGWTVATYGLGFVCLCLPVPSLLLAINDINNGLRLNRGEIVPDPKNQALMGMGGSIYACVAGLCTLLAPIGALPLVLQALAVAMLNRAEVQDWLALADNPFADDAPSPPQRRGAETWIRDENRPTEIDDGWA